MWHRYPYTEHFSLFAYTSSLWIMYTIHRKFETSTNQDMSIVDYAISVTFDWLVDVHKIKSSANSRENSKHSIIMNWRIYIHNHKSSSVRAYIGKNKWGSTMWAMVKKEHISNETAGLTCVNTNVGRFGHCTDDIELGCVSKIYWIIYVMKIIVTAKQNADRLRIRFRFSIVETCHSLVYKLNKNHRTQNSMNKRYIHIYTNAAITETNTKHDQYTVSHY